MTRKLLSGVLAFAMVFGCTAPVALAEDTTVEEVEQYNLVDYQLSATTLKFNPGDTATQIVNLTGYNDTSTVSISTNASDLKHFTVTDKLAENGYVLVAAKPGVSNEEETLVITIKNKGDSGDIATITRNVTLKVGVSTTTYQPVVVSPISVANGASNSISLVQNGKDADNNDITYNVQITDVLVSDKTGSAISATWAGNTITVKGLKEMAKVANALKVTYVDAAGLTKTAYIDVTVTAKKDVNYKWVSKSESVKADSTGKYLVQAYRINEYGEEYAYDAGQSIDWYVNGKKMTVGNVVTDTKGVELLKMVAHPDYANRAGARAIEFYVPGVYTVTVKAANTDNVLETTTVTVGLADVESVGVWNGDVKEVQLGRSYKINKIAKVWLTTMTGSTGNTSYQMSFGEDPEKVTGKGIIDPSYSIKVTLNSTNATDKATFASNVNVDLASGTLTIADTEAMQKILDKGETSFSVEVIAASGAKGTIKNAVGIVKYDAETDRKVTIQVNGKNATSPYVIKTGDTVDFDAVVTDVKSGATLGNDQTVVWSIEYTSIEGIIDGIQGKKFATVDQNGKVTALAPAAGKIAVVATSANYGEEAKIYLSIVGEAPTEAPTAAPTAAPELKGTVNTSSSALNIRAAASTTAGVVTKAAKGSTVTILGEENGFYKVKLADGTIGYASKAYIKVVTDTPVVTITATTTANLKLRTSAPSGSVITVMPKGATVKVIEGGQSWAKVEYNGKVGYASNNYLTFNTVG